MNAYQVEKCRRIVGRKGFDTQQDKLVDECERLIETAQGDDYDTFITALANVRIIVNFRLTKNRKCFTSQGLTLN